MASTCSLLLSPALVLARTWDHTALYVKLWFLGVCLPTVWNRSDVPQQKFFHTDFLNDKTQPTVCSGCVSPRTTLQRGCCGSDMPPLIYMYEKVTSSTKPEIYNISQRCHYRTEPRPHAGNRNRNIFWSWDMWLTSWDIVATVATDIHTRTDRQTRSSQHSASLPWGSNRKRATINERQKWWQVMEANSVQRGYHIVLQS